MAMCRCRCIISKTSAARYRQTIDAIASFAGRQPRGWESPGLTETFETADLLAAEGIEYVADWVLDDQPCELATDSGKLISIPYTVEMNDVAMMAVGMHASEEWLSRGVRQFQRLYQESASITRIMSISIHPYLSGVPHRIGYVEELLDLIRKEDGIIFMTGEEILDWYVGQRQSDKLKAVNVRHTRAQSDSRACVRCSKRLVGLTGLNPIVFRTASLRIVQPNAARKHASAASCKAGPSIVSTQSSITIGA